MKTTLLNKSALVAGTAALLTLIMSNAHAEPTGYNQLSFQAEAKEEIKNDEVTASLYKQAQADDAKTLATTLNTSINQALAIAKGYPSVTVSTGQQRTYPRYSNEDSKIIGWTGQTSINLKSNDFAATSQLIADLQETLVMENLNFGVSEAKRDALEQKLMTDASRAFQQQAKSLTRAWDASGYRIISVNLNTRGNYPMPVARMNAQVDISSDSVPSPSFESGMSTVSVIANGTIELSK